MSVTVPASVSPTTPLTTQGVRRGVGDAVGKTRCDAERASCLGTHPRTARANIGKCRLDFRLSGGALPNLDRVSLTDRASALYDFSLESGAQVGPQRLPRYIPRGGVMAASCRSGRGEI